MSDPATLDEYNRRFFGNQRVSGYGLETKCHVPCPFCAAPDFLEHLVLETESAYSKGAVCKECGRGCRAEFSHPAPGHTAFTLVQTEGPNPPDYLPPMRRVP